MQKVARLARAVVLAVALIGTRTPWELRALILFLAWVLPNLLVAFLAANGATMLLGLVATNTLALGLALRRAYRLPPSRETEWTQVAHPVPVELPPVSGNVMDTIPLEIGPHAPVATKRHTYIHDN